MVKGISRQVIVVQSPDPKLFEQAIFILKDEVVEGEGITNEALLKEANRLIKGPMLNKKRKMRLPEAVWIAAGAAMTGFVWLISSIL